MSNVNSKRIRFFRNVNKWGFAFVMLTCLIGLVFGLTGYDLDKLEQSHPIVHIAFLWLSGIAVCAVLISLIELNCRLFFRIVIYCFVVLGVYGYIASISGDDSKNSSNTHVPP